MPTTKKTKRRKAERPDPGRGETEPKLKIAINAQHGGFRLSRAGVRWLHEHGSKLVKARLVTKVRAEIAKDSPSLLDSFERELKTLDEDTSLGVWIPTEDGKYVLSQEITNDDRTDPLLIMCIEKLGRAANARVASLRIIEIPLGVKWDIEEYDGLEWVAEAHRTWR